MFWIRRDELSVALKEWQVFKRFTALLISLSLAWLTGCVSPPDPESNLTPEEKRKRVQDRAKIHTELAGQYYSRGQYRVAIEEAEIALRANNNYAPAYNVLGLIYMDLREDGRAQVNFERAIRIAPNDADVHNNYGWFLCRNPAQIDLAIDHFMQAIKDPFYEIPEKSYTNAGLCVLKRNDFEQAKAYLQKALVIHPDYPLAVLGLIQIDYLSRNLRVAQTNITRYIQSYPLSADSLWLAIRIEHALGNDQAVASYGAQLQRRFPDSNEARSLREGKLRDE